MKITTVTGEQITLSKHGGYRLNWVSQCGADLYASITLHDGEITKNNRNARVFASQNPGVETLISLAHDRGELIWK